MVPLGTLTRLVIEVFICLFCFTNLFIFSLLVALYSYMELHLACFFFGLASSTPSLFILFLIVFCLLCKPVDLDSLNFIWVCFSQCGYILGHLKGKYTRGQSVILNSTIKLHNLQYECYVTRCLIRAFKWMHNLLQTSV